FAALLAVKGPLRRATNTPRALDRCGRCKSLRQRGKSRNKKSSLLAPKFCARMPYERRSLTPSTHSIPLVASLSLHYLSKAQLGLQRSLHVKRTEDLLLQTFFHRPAQNLWAMTLQNLVQPINIREPVPRPTMHDLGEIANRRLS